MSAFQQMSQRCWREECQCLGHCNDCNNCTTEVSRDNDPQECEALCDRFLTVGSVRYGLRLGAVSPPPPGAGPRYKSQCCWPATAAVAAGGGGSTMATFTPPSTTTTTPGFISRVSLFTTPSINNFDIISCANRVRIVEDARSTTSTVSAFATSASELLQPQQLTVRDHVYYSTKCLLKRCALVRPQTYSRLCDHADAKPDEEEIFNTLDRLPRFRFGGNRANSGVGASSNAGTSVKGRDLDKKAGEQRLKEITDRLKKGPIPPPRTRHNNRMASISSLTIQSPITASTSTSKTAAIPSKISNVDAMSSESNVARHPTTLRSASFSQVDYCTDNKKYVRNRNLPNVGNDPSTIYNRNVVTLPRSKNLNRSTISSDINSRSNVTNSIPPPVSVFVCSPPQVPEVKNESISLDASSTDIPERDTNEIPVKPLDNNKPIINKTDLSQDKKRDKFKRRKGIYISRPNSYRAEKSAIPCFIEDGDFTASNSGLLQERSEDTGSPQSDDKLGDFPVWSSPQEEPLSPDDSNIPPEWPNYNTSRIEEGDMLKVSRGINLLRSDSLSEGEPDGGRTEFSYLAHSDVSDCESRTSVGNESNLTRRYSKRPLRGPYGQMLEAEMKKPESGRRMNNELKFLLEDLSSSSTSSLQNISAKDKIKYHKTRGSCNISTDETHSQGRGTVSASPKQSMCKRKVSADNLVAGVVVSNETQPKLVVNHQRTTSSPSKLEGFTNANTHLSSEVLEHILRASSEQLASNSQQTNDTRTHVVVELYDNERIYVESLQTLITNYLEPLKSPENANLLESALVDEIFYQIPFLLTHHQDFLEEMRKRLENWDIKQKIGDIFLDMFSKAPVIESYTNYVNNWKRAREILKNAQQTKPAFAKFIETTAREHKGKLSLDSLLIKPIQKFPKYELLLARLIKHTDVSHPDHNLLLAAQKEVHDQLLKINCTEREALEVEQLREIESLIEGLIDLVSADRQYLRHDLVTMAAGSGARKERALFLFSDLLLVTSIKRRSGTIKRPPVPTSTGPGTVASTLDANKYKLLMKIPLEDLDIVRSKDENFRQIMTEIENLTEDISLLNRITELSWSLHCSHSTLDELIRDMLTSLNKQLIEQQTSDSQLSCLDITLNTTNGPENVSIVFSKQEKRASWEESFLDAKHKLAVSGERKPCPEIMATVPIRKTRAGLQFTCAAPTLGDSGSDVWVCNSDGYVGQVCVLSLQPEPTVTSCNSVCNARILCVASVPGISSSFPGVRSSSNKTEVDEPKTMQFDSSSSSDEDYKSDNDDEVSRKSDPVGHSNTTDSDETDNLQSTMWLGTEDGCIHVYNSSDNIRTKKNKIRLQHNASILCIIYLDNRVFVSLANGDIVIYERDGAGGWNINTPTTITVGSTAMPVSKMLPNSNKLWCGCGSNIKIFNTQTLVTEKNFTVNNDSNKPITCIILSGNGVWLSLQNSAIVKCFHAMTFEPLCEVNVAPAVTKMLTSCDDIIRQHKAACLRVTALLACKDLLWVGTSAGVLLTMPLPHIPHVATSMLKMAGPPVVTGVSHGHTGHVRFLTFVEIPGPSDSQRHNRNSTSKNQQDQRTSSTTPASTATGNASKLLVISGGDGYEDFRNTNLSEIAGREDSTNHLLLWNI